MMPPYIAPICTDLRNSVNDNSESVAPACNSVFTPSSRPSSSDSQKPLRITFLNPVVLPSNSFLPLASTELRTFCCVSLLSSFLASLLITFVTCLVVAPCMIKSSNPPLPITLKPRVIDPVSAKAVAPTTSAFSWISSSLSLSPSGARDNTS